MKSPKTKNLAFVSPASDSLFLKLNLIFSGTMDQLHYHIVADRTDRTDSAQKGYNRKKDL